MYCILCGDEVERRERLKHLQKHRLGDIGLLESFFAYHQAYRKVFNFRVSESKCPFCNNRPSPIVYRTYDYSFLSTIYPELARKWSLFFPTERPNNLLFLCRCSNCDSFFLVAKSYI